MARILLVDDETLVRGALARLLEQRGFEVSAAADGLAALASFRKSAPDLVLLDRELPGMTGSRVLEEIRRLDRNVKVVVLTGHPGAPGEEKYAALGVARYLSKDISVENLLRIVEGLTATASRPPLILVADDDPAVRGVLKRFLSGKGYRVELAENGQEALEAIARGRPDLVLLDLAMPVLSGLETLKQIQRMKEPPAVIMVTGSEDKALARECIELGARDYIVKPFDLDYLETSVWTLIETAAGKESVAKN